MQTTQKIQVISPWREWELNSRNELIEFCRKASESYTKRQTRRSSPFSTDANLLHTLHQKEKFLEDPWKGGA